MLFFSIKTKKTIKTSCYRLPDLSFSPARCASRNLVNLVNFPLRGLSLNSSLIIQHSSLPATGYLLLATCSFSQSMVCLRIPIKSIKCNEQLKKQSKLLATRYMLKKQQRQQKQHVAQLSFVPLTPLSLPSHFSFLTPCLLMPCTCL